MSQRIIQSRVLHASGPETADLSGSAKRFTSEKASAYIDVTALSGTAPTVTVIIEEQDELSGKWFEIANFTAAISTVSSERIEIAFIGSGQVRTSWVIGGSAGPSVTFSVAIAGKYTR